MGNVHRTPALAGLWAVVLSSAWATAAVGEHHFDASLKAAHSVTLAASTWLVLLKDEGIAPLPELTILVAIAELIGNDKSILMWWPVVAAFAFGVRCFHVQKVL